MQRKNTSKCIQSSIWKTSFYYKKLDHHFNVATGGPQHDGLLQSRALATLLRGAAMRSAQSYQREGLRDPRGHLRGHAARLQARLLPHGRRRGEHQLLELLGDHPRLDARARLGSVRVQLLPALGSLPEQGLRQADQGEQWTVARRRALDQRSHERGEPQAHRSEEVHHSDLDDWR